MPRLKEPWRIPNKILKDDKTCIDGKPHRLRIISLTRTDSSDGSLPNGHIKSEVVYQCVVCKKYQIDRYTYPKIKRVSA
jgi:hypothetical protein